MAKITSLYVLKLDEERVEILRSRLHIVSFCGKSSPDSEFSRKVTSNGNSDSWWRSSEKVVQARLSGEGREWPNLDIGVEGPFWRVAQFGRAGEVGNSSQGPGGSHFIMSVSLIWQQSRCPLPKYPVPPSGQYLSKSCQNPTILSIP